MNETTDDGASKMNKNLNTQAVVVGGTKTHADTLAEMQKRAYDAWQYAERNAFDAETRYQAAQARAAWVASRKCSKYWTAETRAEVAESCAKIVRDACAVRDGQRAISGARKHAVRQLDAALDNVKAVQADALNADEAAKLAEIRASINHLIGLMSGNGL